MRTSRREPRAPVARAGIGGAVAVVGEHDHAASGRALEQAALELGALGAGERQRILDVEAHDLLLDGVPAAGQDAHLAGGAVPGAHQDAVDRDAAAGEQVEQRAPGLVVADEADRQRPAAERGTLATALAPPPGTSSSPSWRRMSTGASRLMRLGVPRMKRSATRSPSTRIGCSANPSISSRRRAASGTRDRGGTAGDVTIEV